MFRSEVIPDKLPSLKQRTSAAWNKLQGMAIAIEDFGWEAKDWMYDHPEEVRKVKYTLAAGTLGLLTGTAVVVGMELLNK